MVEANTCNRMEHVMLKVWKYVPEKWVILFVVTWVFWKMCSIAQCANIMYLIFHDLQLRILTTYTSIWNLRQELFYCHGILLPINNQGITIAMYKISPTLLHPVVVLIMCCCCENKWWVVSSSQIDAQATTIITPCYRPTPVGRLIRTSWCHKKVQTRYPQSPMNMWKVICLKTLSKVMIWRWSSKQL